METKKDKPAILPIRYSTIYKCISLLIPSTKRPGIYLKSPVYHSHNELSLFIADTFDADVCGLDGSLDISVSYHIAEDKEAVLEYVHAIAKFLGVDYIAERMDYESFSNMVKANNKRK